MDLSVTTVEAVEALKQSILHHDNLMITGPPGVGKSDLVTSVTRDVEADLVFVHCVTSDETDAKGLPWAAPGATEATFLPFGDLSRLIKATNLTVCFLDDFGQARASVQASWMQLLLARTINNQPISPNVSFVCATNRKADKAGVSSILEPVKSRFISILELRPDTQSWVKWANENDVPAELVSFIMFRPELLHQFEATAELKNTPSPRTVFNVGTILKRRYSKLLELKMIAGAVGEAFATEFAGFIEIWRSLPDVGQIVLSPEIAVVPTQPATRYAITGALANRVTQSTISPMLRYMKRMPAEFGVLFMDMALQRKGQEISTTIEYRDWFIANQHVLLS